MLLADHTILDSNFPNNAVFNYGSALFMKCDLICVIIESKHDQHSDIIAHIGFT